jgi:YD repeat-containing protein
VIEANGSTTYYGYSPECEVIGIRDPHGCESLYMRDARQRVTEVLRNGKRRDQYTYTRGDKIAEKRDGNGNVLFTAQYNSEGFPTERRYGDKFRQWFEYDARDLIRLGLRTRVIGPGK